MKITAFIYSYLKRNFNKIIKQKKPLINSWEKRTIQLTFTRNVIILRIRSINFNDNTNTATVFAIYVTNSFLFEKFI